MGVIWLQRISFRWSDWVTESDCSLLELPAISPICHSFIMISCPSELLILLKRNACSLQFIISFHFVEQTSTNKPLTPWSSCHSLVFDHEIMIFAGISHYCCTTLWKNYKETRITSRVKAIYSVIVLKGQQEKCVISQYLLFLMAWLLSTALMWT